MAGTSSNNTSESLTQNESTLWWYHRDRPRSPLYSDKEGDVELPELVIESRDSYIRVQWELFMKRIETVLYDNYHNPEAALWDNVELLTDVLTGTEPVCVDAEDTRGRTALHAAAVAERSRCLLALLQHSAAVDKPSSRDSGAKTALHVSAERGHSENIKALLAAGADLTLQDACGQTALELAERGAHRHAAAILRDARDALERTRQSQHRHLRELVSRGESGKLRLALSRLGNEAGLLVNLAPGGANTLLYTAAESGCVDATVALLTAGADGRAHSVTRYSPLYAAAYRGHLEIVRILLHYFPELAQQETVERWLPLHAACIGGHAGVLKMMLEFPYPAHLLNTYTEESGSKYEAAFDVNARDVSGQSALYVACTLGNLQPVEVLLEHTASVQSDDEEDSSTTPTPVSTPTPTPTPDSTLSPTRRRISHGIHSIVARLTGQSTSESEESVVGRKLRPVRVDVGCPGDTCLGAAVRRGHIKVVERLLAAGADPNAPCRDTDDLNPSPESCKRTSRQQRPRSTSALPRRSSPSPSPCRSGASVAASSLSDAHGRGALTPLGLAARARQHRLAELLLAHGATDVHCVALREAAQQSDELMLCRLLATKASADPEYKLNRSVVAECVFASERAADASLTYNAMSPGTPVALDWRELHAQLNKIRLKWLVEAARRVNPRLADGGAALHALTRVDVSGNELRELPATLFSLASLRYLNAAQNKLERLPTSPDAEEEDSPERRGRRRRPGRPPCLYSAPVLEELYLQDNRLEEVPALLFSLPGLVSLDVSNNKLRVLPAALWRAPRLRDLNAALNHLRDLPLPAPPTPDNIPKHMGECASPSASPSVGVSGSSSAGNISQFFFGQKSTSRSSSIEQVAPPASPTPPAPPAAPHHPAPRILNRAPNATLSEARRVHVWRRALQVSESAAPPATSPAPSLASLNLAHNQFTSVPSALACLAPQLTRLNVAYNSLRSMSYVTSYPATLRQLDLSHNEITCWPSLPQLDSLGGCDGAALACYCAAGAGAGAGGGTAPRPRSGGSVRAQILNSVCPARRHLRLESLRTLILANNLLTRIQLTTDDDGSTPLTAAGAPALAADDDDDDWSVVASVKARLLFPNLSMLDVSCNLLRNIPAHIHDLANLSVLNVSGNKDITELPPQMGLLSRLWNLNTAGCPLQEPLRSMLASHKYKSCDVIGYLKSVLEEAQPYARMKLMLVGAQGRGKTSLLECLRNESNILHRRKPTEHWTKRMGNKTAALPGKNISTVGVDIGTWIYEKHRAATPAVTFRTWDFGGQHEYYATHQYFLSRRSLYLVVWKVTEGRRGLAGVLKWLRAIQARAPGSPAIIVATHYDAAINSPPADGETPESLQRLIRTHLMGAADADKLGLPRVWDSVEVSCVTRHNVRLLADIIYTCAYSIKPPGSKEPLLEQRVPATYLALEECVATLAADLRTRGAEPVLRHDQYKQQVTQLMQQKFHRSFRDAAELHQATMFLHENGVMLHYDDATLKELYFLEPQWLCDMLAHVVTVREINPFASRGIMKLEELQHVFKSSPLACRSEEARALVLSLLNKFELALGWDGRCLLVPPLLPANPDAEPVTLSLRARHWAGSARSTPQHRAWAPPLSLPPTVTSAAASLDQTGSGSGTQSPTLVGEDSGACTVWGRGGCERALRRLLLLSYIPCGFWPRLITRVLADDAVADIPHHYYKLPSEACVDATVSRALDLPATWQLWQSELRLVLGELTLLSVREVPTSHAEDLFGATAPLVDSDWEPSVQPGALDYRSYRFRLKQDGSWCELDASASSIVEVLLPAQVLVVRRPIRSAEGECLGYQNLSVEPSAECEARLLSLISDHVDLLLEDWYPTLGTRFVHTSEGRCLITRISPCGLCLRDPQPPPPHADLPRQLHSVLKRLEVQAEAPVRVSTDSRASDGDSGVGAESTASSRMGSVEGALAAGGDARAAPGEDARPLVYSWSVEECILTACGGAGGADAARLLSCPAHGDRALALIAPDTMMLDVDEERRARWEQVTRGALLGRGAFGLVFRAEWRRPGRAPESVALKVLQPVPPGAGARLSARQAYKAAVSRWSREPAAAACRAYCGARQELAVLAPLRHAHVVPLRAVCTAPLALLLHLAPMGALNTLLRQYRGCGARVGARAARALALQVARALEYLHSKHIVYRDLKAENVLVWRAPQPQEAAAAERAPAPISVLVKLGDYGISRLTLPSGTKGFGGTEGFMAPEIMRYNGEEEYTEKVDCFSFGMFLYEVLTLRQPFEGHEAVKEAILEGARPALAPRDTMYPCYMLDLMCCCWSGQPEPRPSASGLVSLCSAPEYSALQDVASPHAHDPAPLPPASAALPAAATSVASVADEETDGWEVWWGAGSRLYTLVATPSAFTHHYTFRLAQDSGATEEAHVSALCAVGEDMWVGDSGGHITVYSIATCAVSWRCRVEESVGGGGARAGVAAILSLAPLPRLAVAMDNGRLFVVTSERGAGQDTEVEGSFVLTELGTAGVLSCLAAVPADNSWDVWCGGAGLWCYEVGAGGVAAAYAFPAAPPTVALLAADSAHVFSYSTPGCVVLQWCARRREVLAKLDCSKLVPCSESLNSIAIEEHLSPTRCQVVSLCVLEGLLYAGTAWGCIVVAEASSLRPVTVFRPYEQDVAALVALRARTAEVAEVEGEERPAAMLASLGSGYRSLLARYTDLSTQMGCGGTAQAGAYCLLWRAQHWTND